MRLHSLPLSLTVLVIAATPALADTIYLIDGSQIDDCKVTTETLLTVAYKEGNKKGEVAADQILSIDFSKMPSLVDRAETAAEEDALLDAVADYSEYLDGVLSRDKPPAQYKWAPAYAMYRLVELNAIMGNSAAVDSAANQLLEKAPDSRYVPLAYLKQIDALADLQKDPTKTIEAFSELIDQKQLSQRWKLERNLAVVLYDAAVTGEARRDKLNSVARKAGTAHPLVRNRARVAIAEAYLQENKISDAEVIFTEITDDPKADDRTLAAAHSGRGDCLRIKAEKGGNEDKDALKDAVLSYMRVVIVYKNELRYAPRAMFYAGRTFDALGEEQDKAFAQKLYIKVMRSFPGSRWAKEARGFKK